MHCRNNIQFLNVWIWHDADVTRRPLFVRYSSASEAEADVPLISTDFAFLTRSGRPVIAPDG